MFVPSPPTPYDPRSAQILVVDDEAANLKLLGLMLRTEGYHQVTPLQDPRQVLDWVRQQRPDLILLDINMPHLDGFAVMAQLRLLDDALPAPILVLTAQNGEDFLLRALNGGAADFLSKPFNRRELLARVNNLLLAHLGRRLLHNQNSVLEQLVAQRTEELSQSRLDIVMRLGRASEFRDNETGRHILRMSQASALLARKAGWGETEVERMLHGSPMHDVGKIGIPDHILLKPGALSPEERRLMQTHTTIGADILSGASDPLLVMAREIALCHHEKWDGSGYPQGLAGEAIPPSARIVAITDVFDALTSARPYKKPWPVQAALDFMQGQAGQHFDPALMPLFLGLVPELQHLRDAHAEPGDSESEPAARPTSTSPPPEAAAGPAVTAAH